jgi:hypothetical protein
MAAQLVASRVVLSYTELVIFYIVRDESVPGGNTYITVCL